MFALRASCSSATSAAHRRPNLIAALSRKARPAGPSPKSPAGVVNASPTDFLEPLLDEAPSPFPLEDAPPTMDDRGYPRTYATSSFGPNMTVSKHLEPKYRLHCHSTRNNTIVTLTGPNGNTLDWASGGRCKFVGANRASYEAGYQSAILMFHAIEKIAGEQRIKLELFFKGFGQGRDAMKTALLATEGSKIRDLVCSITDRTAIKIGGTRSKKARRL